MRIVFLLVLVLVLLILLVLLLLLLIVTVNVIIILSYTVVRVVTCGLHALSEYIHIHVDQLTVRVRIDEKSEV